MPMKLHPFDPARNNPRPNADGSVSTEITRTVRLPDGGWANVPSLWWGEGSTVRDFGSMSDDQLGEFATKYESQSGESFPRYQNLTAAETAAKDRSELGGGSQGSIIGARSMPTFTPSSDLSSFYMGRMAPPIKLPDGTYLPTPNVLSVDQIYKGMYAQPGPTSREVQTIPITRSARDPVGYGADWNNLNGMVAGAWGDTPPPPVQTASGARPALTEGVQPAGTAQMPPGARPSNIPMPGNLPPLMPPPVQTARAPAPRGRPMFPLSSDPFNPLTPKYMDRLPTNAGEAEFLAAFGPQAQNPALGAIDQLTGSGRSTATPFPMPAYRQPTYAPPAEITVNGGTRQAPSPLTPSPLLRGQPPAVPSRGGSLGAITFKRGDTVSELAKDRGMTVKSFADLYGIANPNRIKAGDTVIPSVPMPRMPPPALRRTGTQPQPAPERRRSIYVDEFGMIN